MVANGKRYHPKNNVLADIINDRKAFAFDNMMTSGEIEYFAEGGATGPEDPKVVKIKKENNTVVSVPTDSTFYKTQYGSNAIGNATAEGVFPLKDEVYQGGDLDNVTVKSTVLPNTYSAFVQEYKKTKPDGNQIDFVANKLLGLKKAEYSEMEMNTIRNSSALSQYPQYYDKDVADQLERNKAVKFDKDYLILSDANSRGYHVGANGKVIKTFPVITGQNSGEGSKINSREWIKQNPGKNFEDYIDFLGKNKIRYTPSGVYFVGKKVDDPSALTGGIASKAKVLLRDLINPAENKSRIAKRFEDYGASGLMGLKYLDGDVTDNEQADMKAIGEAIHSTGHTDRLKQLQTNSTPEQRKMSNGCVNMDAGEMAYCYKQMEKNSPVFLLREDGRTLNPTVVNYIDKPKPHRVLMNNLYNNYEKLNKDFGENTEDFMQYAANIAGLESNYNNMSAKGEVKEWLAKTIKSDPSVGATQIKWQAVPEDTKAQLKQYGISSAADLDDINKATIAAMYVLKNKMKQTRNVRKAVQSYVGAKSEGKKSFYINKVLGK